MYKNREVINHRVITKKEGDNNFTKEKIKQLQKENPLLGDSAFTHVIRKEWFEEMKEANPIMSEFKDIKVNNGPVLMTHMSQNKVNMVGRVTGLNYDGERVISVDIELPTTDVLAKTLNLVVSKRVVLNDELGLRLALDTDALIGTNVRTEGRIVTCTYTADNDWGQMTLGHTDEVYVDKMFKL